MSGLLGLNRKNRPVINVLGGIRAQTSLYGIPIPILFGRNRVAGNLLDYLDFTSTPITAKGGKGALFGAGGKGQSNFDYAAAVIIALGQGPITGLGAVWDSQGTLPVNDTQETYVVGGSLLYTATQQPSFIQDLGVTKAVPFTQSANDFGSPGPVTLVGINQVPMVEVPGVPGPGEYNQSSDGEYRFNAADTGFLMTINYSFGPPDTVGSDPIQSANLTLFDGTLGQAPWGYILSKHPALARGYTGIAYVASPILDLGSSGVMPNLSYEYYGRNQFGSGTFDCDPRDVIYALLTDPIIGVGFDPDEIGDTTQYSNYCVANSLFMSPVLSDERMASDYIKDYLEATNSEIVLSGALLKIVPYGDTTAVGNGATFTPQTNPIYDLNDDDFIDQEGKAPLTIERSNIVDAYNAYRSQFTDRNNGYNPGLIEAQDLGAIQRYGYRPTTDQYDFFTTQIAAAAAAQTRLQRSVYVRNTYKTTLSQRYVLLDPMDIVTLTDVALGMFKTPARITSISESGKDKRIDIELEEFPWGTSAPTLYPKQNTTSNFPDANADPGDTNPPIIFEAIPRLRGTDPNTEIWIGLSGIKSTWGGCRVWLSIDGGEYLIIGTQSGRSVMGTCAGSPGPLFVGPWPIGVDPDTVNDLLVELAESLGTLESFSTETENAFGSLCLVGNGSSTPPYELMSYGVAQPSGPNQYLLKATGAGNFLRRGVFGTPITAHPLNSPFLFINSQIFVARLDPSLIGHSLSFKFTSFNTRLNMEQNVSTVTAYPFTPTGLQQGLYAYGYRPIFDTPPGIMQDTGTPTQLDVGSFIISTTANAQAHYNGHTFTGLSTTGLYYVYVFDPNFAGENSITGPATYEANLDITRGGQPGWFFLGSIQMVSGGGGTGGGGGPVDPGGGGGGTPIAT